MWLWCVLFWCWCKSEAWQIAMGQVSTCHCLTLRFSMARPKPKSFEKSRAIFEFSLVGFFTDIIHQKSWKNLWVKFTVGIYQDMFFFQFLWLFDSMSILLGIGLEWPTGQIILSILHSTVKHRHVQDRTKRLARQSHLPGLWSIVWF